MVYTEQSPSEPLQRKPKGAFVVCADVNWVWQSAFVLQQAIASDPEGMLDYHFVTDCDIGTSPHAHLLDPRVRVSDLSREMAETRVHGNTHVPKSTFLRFLALDRLTPLYDQVVYADGDLLLSWGSWTDLFGLPGHRRAVAAVASRSIWFNSPKWRYGRKYRKALSEKMGDRYLNAGVLLVNSDRYLAESVSQRALDFFERNPALCAQNDQSALNAVLEGDWDELSPSWNWQVSPFNLPVLADFHPRIIHFTGPIKPWNDRNGLFDPAFDSMVQYLTDHGSTDLLDQIQSDRLASGPVSLRRQKFRASWTEDREIKLSRINRYLERRDFIDSKAGLRTFSETRSGFGNAKPAGAPDHVPGSAPDVLRYGRAD